MAYHVYPEGKKSWRVVFENWENGERSRRTLPLKDLEAMGISKTLSREEVKERIAPYNAHDKLRRREAFRNRLLARRQRDNLVICAYLPPSVVKEFEKTVLKPKAIRMEHWETAKKAIRAVAVAPKDWYFEPWHFYNWFIEKKYSTDYSNRIRSQKRQSL